MLFDRFCIPSEHSLYFLLVKQRLVFAYRTATPLTFSILCKDFFFASSPRAKPFKTNGFDICARTFSPCKDLLPEGVWGCNASGIRGVR